MIKKLLFILIFLINQSIAGAINMNIIINSDKATNELPKNFRLMTHQSLRTDHQDYDSYLFKNLDSLATSGSGQFSENELIRLKQIINNKKLVIVDLREESHFFINKIAVSIESHCNFANINKSLIQITAEEQQLVNKLKESKTVSVKKRIGNKSDNLWQLENIDIEKVSTEQELLTSMGIRYIRIPMTDHRQASDQAIKQLVNLFNNPDLVDAHFHFHCAGGRGRTTTALIIVDMLKNYKLFTVDEIVSRQFLLNGSNLSRKSALINKPACLSDEQAYERINKLESFYQSLSIINDDDDDLNELKNQ